jgi:hypothetical protein
MDDLTYLIEKLQAFLPGSLSLQSSFCFVFRRYTVKEKEENYWLSTT